MCCVLACCSCCCCCCSFTRGFVVWLVWYVRTSCSRYVCSWYQHLVSACVRFPRASVSSPPSCVCIKSIQLHLSAVARFGLFSYLSCPSGIYRRAFVSLVRLYHVYIFPCIFRTQQRMVELARTWCTNLATRRQFAFPSCVCIKSIFFLAFFVLNSGWLN